MRELENEIALLEMRSKQILIQLQRLPRDSRKAVVARANLDTHVQRLVIANAKRAREQRFACAAGFRTKKARALWGDTRSRSAVIGKLNRTCRQIEGRW